MSELGGSNGIAFGPDGRLYVAQFLAGRIAAVDITTGDVDVVVSADGPVRTPDDLAFGADGTMYIADLVPGRVWQRDPRGELRLVASGIRAPNGITCAGNRLFVNEMVPGGRLLELSPAGGEPVVLTGDLAMGNAMQIGPDGYLYYPHMLTDKVFRISPDGGDPELVAADVHEPVAVRFDRGGQLVVVSRGAAGIVTRIDVRGAQSVVTSGVAGLDNAAFDQDNRMFVSSFASGGITEMHEDGRTRTIVRRRLTGPYGVAVGPDGTVYAADHYRLASPPGPAQSPAPPDPSQPPGPPASSAPAPAPSSAHAPAPPSASVPASASASADGIVTHELLHFAHGIAVDGTNVHLTSQYGHVRTYETTTRTVRLRTSDLKRPLGIAVRADGTLLVAESDAGRVIAIDADDTVTVLAEGLGRPVDVAFDAAGRCFVTDEHLGAILRLDAGPAGGPCPPPVVVADGLVAPQGLVVRGDDLVVVESGARRLRAISLTTGESQIEAEDLAVGTAPGPARPEPALFSHGMPGVPRPFAGLAVAPDGTLHLAAHGDGRILTFAAPS